MNILSLLLLGTFADQRIQRIDVALDAHRTTLDRLLLGGFHAGMCRDTDPDLEVLDRLAGADDAVGLCALADQLQQDRQALAVELDQLGMRSPGHADALAQRTELVAPTGRKARIRTADRPLSVRVHDADDVASGLVVRDALLAWMDGRRAPLPRVDYRGTATLELVYPSPPQRLPDDASVQPLDTSTLTAEHVAIDALTSTGAVLDGPVRVTFPLSIHPGARIVLPDGGAIVLERSR